MPKKTGNSVETTDSLKNDASTVAAIFIQLEVPFTIERLTSYWRLHTKEKIFEFTRLGKLRTVEDQFAWPRIPGGYYARLNE